MNWLKQATDKPLFPDLLWSRPENKIQAGKLLVAGGNLHGFTAVAKAFAAAEKAGVGAVRVVMPDKLQKTVGKMFPEAEFAPSTPSGSFGRAALAQLLEVVEWSDGVLLTGDFGKNSETAILLESFLDKFRGLVTISGDAVDYFLKNGDSVLSRKDTVISADFSRLQALAKHNRPETALTHSMGLYELVKALAEWSKEVPVSFVTAHQDNVVVASAGRVSTTPIKTVKFPELSAYVTVWLIQQPDKTFESLTSGVFEYTKILNQA